MDHRLRGSIIGKNNKLLSVHLSQGTDNNLRLLRISFRSSLHPLRGFPGFCSGCAFVSRSAACNRERQNGGCDNIRRAGVRQLITPRDVYVCVHNMFRVMPNPSEASEQACDPLRISSTRYLPRMFDLRPWKLLNMKFLCNQLV